MQELPQFLKDKNLIPNVEINPDLTLLGTETAFDFGAKVMEVEESGKFSRVYKFHVGDTGPKTPEPIIEVAIKALKDKQTKYGHFLGYPQVRENIAKHWSETRGVEIKKENVMLQPGGKPVIEMAIQALVKPGDKVVAQSPGYPIYESLGRFYSRDNFIPWFVRKDPDPSAPSTSSGQVAPFGVSSLRSVLDHELSSSLSLRAEGGPNGASGSKTGRTQGKTFEFKVEDLEKILQENNNVKLLIINTPQNPTGMILSKEMLERVAELVKKYKFMVLFDDIYDQIVFGRKKHFSILSIPGMLDYTVNLNGYSKNYAMTGWRLGFIVAPEWVIEIFGKFAINKYTCVSRVNQIVAGTIFGNVELDGFKYEYVGDKIKPILEKDFAEYEKKGKFVEQCFRLLQPYVVPNEPEGAFYLMPNFEKVLNLPYVKNELNIKSDSDFSYWLLYERGIATLAGSDFGEGGRGHIRFSYAEDRDAHIIPGMKHVVKTIVELIEKSGEIPPLKVEEVESKVKEIEGKCF